jgi:WhiB family redox-sensing transcriptional regulator
LNPLYQQDAPTGEKTMGNAANWNTMGNCRSGDPDRMFVTGAAQQKARLVCRNCPVLKQCLAMALTEKIKYGVWGGTTERERRAIRKARPDVTCWSTCLDQLETSQTTTATTTQPLAPVLPLHRTTTATTSTATTTTAA